jgi:chromosome segregation ATPase
LSQDLNEARVEIDKHEETVAEMQERFEKEMATLKSQFKADMQEMANMRESSMSIHMEDDAVNPFEMSSRLDFAEADVQLLKKEVKATRNEWKARMAALKVEHETTVSEMSLSFDRELEQKTREAQEATSRAEDLKQSLEYSQTEVDRLKKEVQNSRQKQEERVAAMQKTHKKFYDRQAEELAKANKQVADMTRKLDVARGEARRFCEQISTLRQDADKGVAEIEAAHKAKLAEIEANQRMTLEERNAEIKAVKNVLHETCDRLKSTQEESDIYQKKMIQLAGRRASMGRTIKTKLANVTSEMESAYNDLEEHQNNIVSISSDNEKVTTKLRTSEEKLISAVDEAESCRLKISELEETVQQLEKEKNQIAAAAASASTAPRKGSGLWTLLGITGLLFSIGAALFLVYRADAIMLDYVCAPVQPGTVVSGGDIHFEAPWWAPDDMKESAFASVCPKRSRSRFTFSTLSGGKFSVFKLNGTAVELMWRKSGARAVVGHDKVVITDKKHEHKQEIVYPWRF